MRQLKKLAVGPDTYTVHFDETTSQFALCLEPNPGQDDGCEVEEMPHDLACRLLAELFTIYIYHAETHEEIK